MTLTPSRITYIVLAALILGLGGMTMYYHGKYQTLAATVSATPKQEDVRPLMDQLSKLMVLPQGEAPTIATVSDPDKLKAQPFFANAEKNDRLIIYANAREAILFRPTENKIIQVAPLLIGSASTTTKVK